MLGCIEDIIMLETWNNGQELESIGISQENMGVELLTSVVFH